LIILIIIFGEEPVILYEVFSNLLLFSSFYVEVFSSALSFQLPLSLFLSLMWAIKFRTHTEQHEHTNRCYYSLF